MSDQPTPETDALRSHYCEFEPFTNIPIFNLAEKLERQLDEARKEVELLKKTPLRQKVQSLERDVEHWCDMHTVAVKRCDEVREVARELRDALAGMEEYYRQHIIQASLFLQVHAALTKAKEVLP